MRLHTILLLIVPLVGWPLLTKLDLQNFLLWTTLAGNLEGLNGNRRSLMGLGASRAVNMGGPVADFVKTKINSDTVVIFSKSYCPYCRMAKEVFDKLNHKYTAIELDQRDDEGEVQDVLGQITGARTVPRVFLKGQFIGGGTDVQKLYGSGELQKMIAA